MKNFKFYFILSLVILSGCSPGVIMERIHNTKKFDLKKGGQMGIISVDIGQINDDGTINLSQNCDMCNKAYDKVHISMSKFVQESINNFSIASQTQMDNTITRCFLPQNCKCPQNIDES